MIGSPTIDRGYCHKCHARILWVQMARKPDGSPGKKMPLDPAWVVSDGKKTLVIMDEENYGHVVVNAADGTTGRESHFATCPAAEHFRKEKAKAELPKQQSLF